MPAATDTAHRIHIEPGAPLASAKDPLQVTSYPIAIGLLQPDCR